MDDCSQCPTLEELQAFGRGELAESGARRVESHLEHCGSCAAQVPGRHSNGGPTLALRPRNSQRAAEQTPALESSAVPDANGGGAAGAGFHFLSPPLRRDEIGRLANYRVLRLLGRGGMGMVFHAEDLSLSRAVALKVMKPDLDTSIEPWERFFREARTLAAIKHPHVVTVYQVGHEGNVAYLAMEFLEGESLDAWLNSGRQLTVAEIVRLGREIASGLVAIHRNGLVHRDIKPANLWLEAPDARIKILDFGLARRTTGDTHLTSAGAIVGSPAYMSPEQARGEPVDARSDLFGLGCVLYAMCTGKEPFRGPNPMAQLIAQAVEEPQPIRLHNSAIPDELAKLVMNLLAKRRDARPASAKDVVAALDHIGQGMLLPPAKAPAGESVLTRYRRELARSRWTQRLSRSPTTAAMLLILLVLGVWSAVSVGRRLVGSSVALEQVYLADLQHVEAKDWPIPPPAREAGRPFRPPHDEEHPPPRQEGRKKGPLPPPTADGPGGDFFAVISIQGIPYAHGIGMHASPHGLASLSYSLGKQYSTFATEVSLNDTSPRSPTPLTFAVYGDDQLLWKSRPVSFQNDRQTCSVPVKGVDVLKLTVTSPDSEVKGAHGVWLDPYVSR